MQMEDIIVVQIVPNGDLEMVNIIIIMVEVRAVLQVQIAPHQAQVHSSTSQTQSTPQVVDYTKQRSEERRVGKECRL